MILVSTIKSSFTNSVKFFAKKYVSALSHCFHIGGIHISQQANFHSGELPVSYFLKPWIKYTNCREFSTSIHNFKMFD